MLSWGLDAPLSFADVLVCFSLLDGVETLLLFCPEAGEQEAVAGVPAFCCGIRNMEIAVAPHYAHRHREQKRWWKEALGTLILKVPVTFMLSTGSVESL